MKKLLNIFFSGLYYGFVIVLIAAGGALLAMQTPILGGTELKIVRSGSMEPAIMTGAVVLIRPAEVYNVGDVITFGADTKTQVPTTHRIIEKSGEGARATYKTQGDANQTPDGNPVAHREIIGKVAYDVPHVGFVLDFARQPLGFALLIAVPAAAVILDELWTIGREIARRRKGSALVDGDEVDEEETDNEDNEAYDEDESDELVQAAGKGDGRPYYAAPVVARISPHGSARVEEHSQAKNAALSHSRHAPARAARMSGVATVSSSHRSQHVTVIPPRPYAGSTERVQKEPSRAVVSLDGIINLRYARR